jgi:hypothetical protein
MRRVVAGIWLLAAGVAWGQAPGDGRGQVKFQFERAGLDVPRYSIAVSEDGVGLYHAEPAAPAGGGAAGPAIDRVIPVSQATAGTIFALAREAKMFQMTCQSNAKNIADTGKKVLSYAGRDGKGECEFHYSEVKPVVELTGIFQGMETTLEFGQRMDFKRRFDRLGLDAEMIQLEKMLAAHEAMEVGVIAPTLRAIAGDTELLQRVRLRAVKMLDEAQ